MKLKIEDEDTAIADPCPVCAQMGKKGTSVLKFVEDQQGKRSNLLKCLSCGYIFEIKE